MYLDSETSLFDMLGFSSHTHTPNPMRSSRLARGRAPPQAKDGSYTHESEADALQDLAKRCGKREASEGRAQEKGGGELVFSGH